MMVLWTTHSIAVDETWWAYAASAYAAVSSRISIAEGSGFALGLCAPGKIDLGVLSAVVGRLSLVSLDAEVDEVEGRGGEATGRQHHEGRGRLTLCVMIKCSVFVRATMNRGGQGL